MNPTKLLPDYPRTQHLCYKPNAQRLDLIASEKDCKILLENENTFCEEKVDGASVGIILFENNPIIRNRSNILQKGKSGHLRTPAKIQFASIWNYFYEHIYRFEKLNELCGFNASVYGEWLYALHGIEYDKLPSFFIPYDIYDWERGIFIPTGRTRDLLKLAGFDLVPLPSYDFLEKFMDEKSEFSNLDKREGVYIKVCNEESITHRFKWVRSDFIQGSRWDERKITKNKLE
jgi:hypothetical protein